MLAKLRTAMIALLVLIAILLMLAFYLRTASATGDQPPPTNVMLYWTRQYEPYHKGVMSWYQHSNADDVCVHKLVPPTTDKPDSRILLGCKESRFGPQDFLLPIYVLPPDPRWQLHDGDRYTITELYYGDKRQPIVYGTYGPYTFPSYRTKVYMPIITR